VLIDHGDPDGGCDEEREEDLLSYRAMTQSVKKKFRKKMQREERNM
jgi:hypothetical protein